MIDGHLNNVVSTKNSRDREACEGDPEALRINTMESISVSNAYY